MTGSEAPVRRRGFGNRLLETYLGRDVSPVIAAIARRHVPEKSREDLLEFLSTGCSTAQLHMIVRYMGGTPVPITHIEIEEMGGALYATGQFPGGLNYTGTAVMMVGQIPETLRTALVGKPLSALVDHPLLPGDQEISRITAMGGILTAEI